MTAPQGETPVSRRFVAAFTAAQIAVFTSFIPLLTILLPLKAAQIDPANKAAVLSQVLLYGALTAGFANVAGGVLSDHTRSPWGRRAPWMMAGSAGVAVAYAVIQQAEGLLGLAIGVVAFQFLLNLLFAPLVSILPDRVPDLQKGSVAAFLALGYPVGSVLGAVLTGHLIESESLRYAALAAIVLAIVPLAYLLREPPGWSAPAPPRLSLPQEERSLARHDYVWTWLSRFLVQTAVSIGTGYLLFFVADAVGYERLFPGRSVEEGVATLVVVSTIANVAASLIGGMLSDRVRRRKPFLVAASAAIGAALALMAVSPTWPAVLAAQVLFGAAFGCFTAVDLALVAQVIPSRRLAGRYLALMNFANTLPQVLAPVIAIRLTGAPDGYQTLFAAAGAIALLGAIAIQPIRRIR